MSRTLFLDIETTGFSRQWNEIIELAAIVVDDATGKDVDSFHQYIKPQRKISEEIAQLTRITNAMVANCKSEQVVLMDFSEWLEFQDINRIVGHNCKSFDLNFIKEKCAHYGITWSTNGIEIIDTLSLARQMKKEGKIIVNDCKQCSLAAYFKVEYDAHSAIEDVKALIKIYNKMTTLKYNVGF